MSESGSQPLERGFRSEAQALIEGLDRARLARLTNGQSTKEIDFAVGATLGLRAALARWTTDDVTDLNHTALEAALREDSASLIMALYSLTYDQREALHEAASLLAKEALDSCTPDLLALSLSPAPEQEKP